MHIADTILILKRKVVKNNRIETKQIYYKANNS